MDVSSDDDLAQTVQFWSKVETEGDLTARILGSHANYKTWFGNQLNAPATADMTIAQLVLMVRTIESVRRFDRASSRLAWTSIGVAITGVVIALLR